MVIYIKNWPCIRLYIVDTSVVVYKFAFDFSLFHRKITIICCTQVYRDHSNNWVSTISIFWSKSVFSILVSISV